MNLTKSIPLLLMTLILGCNGEEKTFDASGSFEADETIVSAEISGIIQVLEIEEGEILKKGDLIGYIDSTQVYLKKKQLEAQIQALLSRKPDVGVQLAALQSQLETANTEKIRIMKLLEDDAATQKQLDDIEAQILMIERQITAQRSSLNITTDGIDMDANTLQVQIEQLEDQIQRCRIVNPLDGTVIAKYSNPMEMAVTGKALYKIADLSQIFLRVYISGDQLSQANIGDEVTIQTDNGAGEMSSTSGTISWISDKAEFTPKTIQTKDERANLVYAVKIRVKNDGTYKIGMYGEILFKS